MVRLAISVLAILASLRSLRASPGFEKTTDRRQKTQATADIRKDIGEVVNKPDKYGDPRRVGN